MDQYRRYGRWLKRAAWVLVIYLFAAWLFMGLSPSQSLSDPSIVMTQLRAVMLQALFLGKLKTIASVLLAVGILGSGAGLLTRQALADRTEKTQTAARKQAAGRAEQGVPPNRAPHGGVDGRRT